MRSDRDMPRKLPKYCVEDVDRRGNVRIYLRRKGIPKVRLEGVPWAPEFMAAYAAAIGNVTPIFQPSDPRKTTPGTWKWLCQSYIGSPAYRALDPVTKRRRRALLEATYMEPRKPGAAETFAEFPLARMSAEAVAVLRDRKAERPEGANNTLKAVRSVFRWATDPLVKLATHNPAKEVPLIQTASDGFHTWAVSEVRQFERRHPLGSKAHLALALLLYGGGRRSDVVVFGRQHIRDGWLKYTHHKNRNSAPMVIEVPVRPELQAAINACPSAHLTFLVTEHGKPFTSNGFGNKFKDWCVEAGLPHCSAHGLRKAGATIAAENGATESQLMALFGWRTAKMAEHYTRKADRKRLAGAATQFMAITRTGESPVPIEKVAK